MANPPPSSPDQVRPSKLWYWVGGLVIVLGFGGGITGFAFGLVDIFDDLEMATEFAAGESTSFHVDQPNTDSESWKLYADQTFFGVDDECEVTGPDGQDVTVTDPGYSSEVTVNGETWHLVAQLDVTETGEHTVTCAADTGATSFGISYGADFASTFLTIGGAIVALLVAPLLGLLIGIPTIVVAAVRRGNHKRRLQTVATGPYRGYGSGPFGPGDPRSP